MIVERSHSSSALRVVSLGLLLLGMVHLQGCQSFKGESPENATASKNVIAGAPIVFVDIAGPEIEKQSAFYGDIFGWAIAPDGKFNISAVSPLPGMLRKDPGEKVIYLGVQDIKATLAKIVAQGGSIDAPRMAIPGVIILALFKDPAGNRMGLIEMDGANVKIPPRGRKKESGK